MGSDDAIGVGHPAPERRIEELRASLSARLDVETLLAEAATARRAAVVDADVILAEAQQVAAGLVSDAHSRTEATALAAQSNAQALIVRARADAETLRVRAEQEVEEHRRRVRAEVTEQVTAEVLHEARAELSAVREQSAAMIGDLEASMRILAVALTTAQANVDDMLFALGELRNHAGESLASGPASPGLLRDDLDDLDDDLPDEFEQEFADELPPEVDEGPDPLADDAPGFEDDVVEDAPRTAMEAYLRSMHIDYHDPPLPDVDDPPVEWPQGRDVTGARASSERASSEADDGHEARTPSRESDRPLGWLFRSSS